MNVTKQNTNDSEMYISIIFMIFLFIIFFIYFKIIDLPWLCECSSNCITGTKLKIKTFFSELGKQKTLNKNFFTITRSKTSIGLDETICTICQDSLIIPTDPVFKLKCGHYFHKTCIQTWFVTRSDNNHKCPVCIKKIVVSKYYK